MFINLIYNKTKIHKKTKFDNFINEATKPTILDCVIDNNGAYDGKQGRPLIKGSVD
jgi:hypothetical protein